MSVIYKCYSKPHIRGNAPTGIILPTTTTVNLFVELEETFDRIVVTPLIPG